MLINEILNPVETAWKGKLVPSLGVFAIRGKAMPKVSIGKPDWWAGQKIFGDAWGLLKELRLKGGVSAGKDMRFPLKIAYSNRGLKICPRSISRKN